MTDPSNASAGDELDVLFTPTSLGAIELRNRIVMAPMTRSKAGEGDEPTDMVVEYYRQRASAGLIITEGIYPSPDGKGYVRTPGLVTDEQVAGWARVCDAVHAEGGAIVAQIMHCGRVAHPDNKDGDAATVAPSAIAADTPMFTDTGGMQALPQPEALTLEGIAQAIGDHRQATVNALEAGFDGVELHGTSGYLPAQFLSTGTNQRTDHYGGSVENRVRFVVETLDAMISAAGADRVGLRICPGNPFNDLFDADPAETFGTLLVAIEPMGLAYLHVLRLHGVELDNLALARTHSTAPLMVNDGYDAAEAATVIGGGEAATVSFGRAFIANPDFVERSRTGAELADFNARLLYTAGEAGFIDYPAL